MSIVKLSEELLEQISYLDAFSGAKGSLTDKGVEMTTNPKDQTIIECLISITDARKRIESNPESQIVIKSVYDKLLPFLGRVKIRELINEDSANDDSLENFEELYARLNSLIGLDNVKKVVNDLIAYHRVQKMREQSGLKTPNRTLHLAFMGNPGTGKTTVARIVGKMYKNLGLLSKGHFVEVSRTDLIAGYQGQTALKVKKVIEKAKGGVLFIDEAYSLTENDHSDSYGRECLTELTKALEDYRKDLVVIVAGYTDLMKNFFISNPGLKSRFNTFIEFDDYSTDDLVKIFTQMCLSDDYFLTPEANKRLREFIDVAVKQKDEKFANGRFVRNLYETIIMNHARRVDSLPSMDKSLLETISVEDLPKDIIR